MVPSGRVDTASATSRLVRQPHTPHTAPVPRRPAKRVPRDAPSRPLRGPRVTRPRADAWRAVAGRVSRDRHFQLKPRRACAFDGNSTDPDGPVWATEGPFRWALEWELDGDLLEGLRWGSPSSPRSLQSRMNSAGLVSSFEIQRVVVPTSSSFPHHAAPFSCTLSQRQAQGQEDNDYAWGCEDAAEAGGWRWRHVRRHRRARPCCGRPG